MRRRQLLVLLSLLLIVSLALTGCGQDTQTPDKTEPAVVEEKPLEPLVEEPVDTKDLPTLKIGYVYTNHQTPLMMAAHKADGFKDQGVYLKEIIAKQKYILMEQDTPIANVELVVNKSGSETMTMIAQGHIDLALASNTAFITSTDQGNSVKILAPVHTEGIALVVPVDSAVSNWEEFSAKVKSGDKPYTVGYHSPTSAPLILLEAALRDAGLTYSKNPEDVKVNITLMDLKGTGNLIPAMTSGQVEAWVGPSPYPELAVTEGVGKVALDMKNLPPEGKWHDFPCCVFGTTDIVATEHNHEVEKLVELLTISANYCAANMEEAAEVTSEFTGVSLEAAKLSTIKYTTIPSEAWLINMGLTYDTLKETDNISNLLKDKSFKEAENDLFNLSFINNVTK